MKEKVEKRITRPIPVLDPHGRPHAGWASRGIFHYDRKAIKAPFYRIKEWDWYQINNDRLVLQFTFGHASYAGQVGVMLFDIQQGKNLYTKDIILPLPFGSQKLGSSAEDNGVLLYDKKNMFLRIEHKDGVRTVTCRTRDFSCGVTMTQKIPNAMVINVPFREEETAFYYNHKICGMAAEGSAAVNGQDYYFAPGDSFGLLDWGRGVWPFHNEWYWSSAAGYLDGSIVAFNLGCGFGNTSAATENAIFYKGAVHKLEEVVIEHEENYKDSWHLTDRQGRVDLILEPLYDRETAIRMLWVDNRCHQVFGKFHGRVTLDDGTSIRLLGFTGFAEHAVNNW